MANCIVAGRRRRTAIAEFVVPRSMPTTACFCSCCASLVARGRCAAATVRCSSPYHGKKAAARAASLEAAREFSAQVGLQLAFQQLDTMRTAGISEVDHAGAACRGLAAEGVGGAPGSRGGEHR